MLPESLNKNIDGTINQQKYISHGVLTCDTSTTHYDRKLEQQSKSQAIHPSCEGMKPGMIRYHRFPVEML